MGSGESTTRKVSFGVDDEDRVRILRGVKVMLVYPSPSSRPQQSSQHRPQPSTQSSTSKPDSRTKEEQRRYEQKQKIHKEELAKAAQREREAAMQKMTKAMNRERQHTRKEAEKTKQLAQQLQKKDSQLKALDAFYKEQLAQLEKRVHARNTDPVCAGLQSQILSCYRENGDQTLRCSDLAKAYMQCINAAKKVRVFSHLDLEYQRSAKG
uniref:Coiled-coil-helix-coiled-coil-helix domain containing 6a n=1 Tax=Seriola lalandi dorsalis TaxID=1841481 RepID=A0A3B4Y403_SERLL